LGDRNFAPIGSPCGSFQKGIDVLAGGTLLMFGAKGVPAYGGISRSHLAMPAGTPVTGAKVPPSQNSDGTQTLELADDVTKITPVSGQPMGDPWQPGDWIVVATTSFNPFETEFVQIKTVAPNKTGGSTITTVEPLKYYHFGSLAPSTGTNPTCKDSDGNTVLASYCDGPDRNYGVDERAEVGLISRDITLTSAVPSNPDSPPLGRRDQDRSGLH
jgi:hypothetical protein